MKLFSKKRELPDNYRVKYEYINGTSTGNGDDQFGLVLSRWETRTRKRFLRKPLEETGWFQITNDKYQTEDELIDLAHRLEGS